MEILFDLEDQDTPGITAMPTQGVPSCADNTISTLPPRTQVVDLVASLNVLVVNDLHAILKLEHELYDDGTKAELLTNWWGARKYILSPAFADDCRILWLDVDVIRQTLAPVITRGRAIYGRVVRTLESINIGGEDADNRDTPL